MGTGTSNYRGNLLKMASSIASILFEAARITT